MSESMSSATGRFRDIVLRVSGKNRKSEQRSRPNKPEVKKGKPSKVALSHGSERQKRDGSHRKMVLVGAVFSWGGRKNSTDQFEERGSSLKLKEVRSFTKPNM